MNAIIGPVAGSNNPVTSAKQRKGFSSKLPFYNLSQQAEIFAARFAPFAWLYYGLFYRDMLAKELTLAHLKPGAKVLHIGGGSYPYTAIYLAQAGCLVHACDCNYSAVQQSARLIENKGLAGQISVFHGNGCHLDCSYYDAVWVSLNICPKTDVLAQVRATLKQGGVLVYRNMPTWLAGRGDESGWLSKWMNFKVQRARSGLGAESVIAKKNGRLANRLEHDDGGMAGEIIKAMNQGC